MAKEVQIKDRNEPASFKQLGYIGKLMAEEGLGRAMTKGEASDLITLFQSGDWYAASMGTALEGAVQYAADQKEGK